MESFLKGSKKPLWLSFTVRDRQGENTPPQLRSGESIDEALEIAENLEVEALLFNCSQPEEMEPIFRKLQKSGIEIPYGAYANAFEPVRKDQQANAEETVIRQDTTPQNYYEYAVHWKNLGASIIGGCCGIGPNHIKELRKLND